MASFHNIAFSILCFRLSLSELLLCDAGNTMSYHTIGDNQVDLQVRHTTEMPHTPEKSRDFLSFTSPFPSFTKVMMSSNVGGKCALVSIS